MPITPQQFILQVNQLLDQNSLTKAEHKYLLKAKKRFDKGDDFQSVFYQLNLTFSALDKSNQEGGLTEKAKLFYELMNSDRPQIARRIIEDGDTLVSSAIIEKNGQQALTKWQQIQKEREAIFEDSGLCPAFVFIDDVHRLVRFTTDMYTVKNYNWQYYHFSEIVHYKRETFERFPYPALLNFIYTYAANGEKTHEVYSGYYSNPPEVNSAEGWLKSITYANSTACRMLDAIIADNKKNGILI